MTQTSLRHDLPYIMPGQSLKHISYNSAIERLDILQSLVLEALNVELPPIEPIIGNCYDIGENPQGIFSEISHKIAVYLDSGWHIFDKVEGMTAFDKLTQNFLCFDGNNWKPINSVGDLNRMQMLGVNIDADSSNKFAVKSDQVLLTSEMSLDNGTGDLRVTLNKSGQSQTASLIFKDQYEARAETGLTGGDNYTIKVGENGDGLETAFEIDMNTRNIGLGTSPSTALDIVKSTSEVNGISMTNNSEEPLSGAILSLKSAQQNSLSLLQYNANTAYMVSSSSTMYYQLTGQNPIHRFYTGSKGVLSLTADKIKMSSPVQLPVIITTDLPSASMIGVGVLAYTSNGLTGAGLVYSDGIDWRYVRDDTLVS